MKACLLISSITALTDPVAQEKHLMIAEGICERALYTAFQSDGEGMTEDMEGWENLQVEVRRGVTAQPKVIRMRERRCDRDAQNLEHLKDQSYKRLYNSQSLRGLPEPEILRQDCFNKLNGYQLASVNYATEKALHAYEQSCALQVKYAPICSIICERRAKVYSAVPKKAICGKLPEKWQKECVKRAEEGNTWWSSTGGVVSLSHSIFAILCISTLPLF